MKFKRQILLFSVLLAFFISTIAQTSADFDYSSIKVKEVDFLSSIGATSKLLIRDDFYPHDIKTKVAWKYPDEQTPVAFLSGIAPLITAKFDCLGNFWVKGDGPDDFDINPTLITSGNLPATSLKTPFPALKIGFYDPFVMTWYASISSNGPWVNVGVSKNPLYVTYKSTTTLGKDFHSSLYYGCKFGNSLTSENAIVDAIYNGAFLPKALIRKDNPTKYTGMSFWGIGNPQSAGLYSNTAEALLRYEDGACGCWARFMKLMLQSQGIPSEIIEVVWNQAVNYKLPSLLETEMAGNLNTFFGVDAQYLNGLNDQHSAEFFVKNWSFDASIKCYSTDFEWDPYGYPTDPITLSNGNILNFAPVDGGSGQGNANPLSTFSNHAIIKYGGKFYDPSYGSAIKASQSAWETEAIAGFGNGSGVGYLLQNSSKKIKRRILWLHSIENNTIQTTFN